MPYLSRKTLEYYYQKARNRGVRVHEVSQVNLQLIYDTNVKGVYFLESTDDYKERTILIVKRSNYKMIYTLFHELGHDNCYVNKCPCLKDLSLAILAEKHAWKYCLEKLREEGLFEILAWVMFIKSWQIEGIAGCSEGIAVSQIRKTKWWAALVSSLKKRYSTTPSPRSGFVVSLCKIFHSFLRV